MKVKELIGILTTQDPEIEVLIGVPSESQVMSCSVVGEISVQAKIDEPPRNVFLMEAI